MNITRPDMKLRRDELRAADRCINGPWQDGTHGRPIRAGKCARCLDQHAAGLDRSQQARTFRLWRELRRIERAEAISAA